MSQSVKILAFSGSSRRDSYNRKMLEIAAGGARAAGAAVTTVDLGELSLPIFSEDYEAAQGPPEGAKRLKQLMIGSDGFLIASPEYNSSITALLKNALDWASRPAAGEPSLAAFTDKVAVLMSASPGALGGLRGLVHLRAILGNINTIVLPQQHALAKAHEVFDASGGIRDERTRGIVLGLGERLAKYLARFGANSR